MENNTIKTDDIKIDVLAMLDEAANVAKEQGKIPAGTVFAAQNPFDKLHGGA